MKRIIILFIFPLLGFSQMKKENLPLFKGKGIETFYNYLSSNAKFPKSDYSYSYLYNVIITETGVMKDIVLVDPGEEGDAANKTTQAELDRVLKLASQSKWKPSLKKGKPTLVYLYFKFYVYNQKVTGDEFYTWEKDVRENGYLQRTSGIVEKRIGTDNVVENSEIIKADPDYVIEDNNVAVPDLTPEDETLLYNAAGVEVKPEFPGGLNKFFAFVAKNFVIPSDEGFSGGKVFISFIVEKDGKLTDIKVIKDIGYGTGNEAIRVMRLSPNWIPGEYNGKKVRCSYTLPITINKP